MQIICNKCSRTMDLSELTPHLLQYFGNFLAPVVKSIVVSALTTHWLTPKKSFVDSSMAALANIAEVKCAKCKKKACWDPYPGTKGIQSSTSQEDAITK